MANVAVEHSSRILLVCGNYRGEFGIFRHHTLLTAPCAPRLFPSESHVFAIDTHIGGSFCNGRHREWNSAKEDLGKSRASGKRRRRSAIPSINSVGGTYRPDQRIHPPVG